MRTSLSVLAVSVFSVLLVATSEPGDSGAGEATSAPEPAAAHCDAISDMSTCVQYASKADAEGDCNSFGGTVGEGACPTDALSGSCAHDGKVRKYYTSGGMPNDADYAKNHCKNAMAGTFTAAP